MDGFYFTKVKLYADAICKAEIYRWTLDCQMCSLFF